MKLKDFLDLLDAATQFEIVIEVNGVEFKSFTTKQRMSVGTGFDKCWIKRITCRPDEFMRIYLILPLEEGDERE